MFSFWGFGLWVVYGGLTLGEPHPPTLSTFLTASIGIHRAIIFWHTECQLLGFFWGGGGVDVVVRALFLPNHKKRSFPPYSKSLIHLMFL